MNPAGRPLSAVSLALCAAVGTAAAPSSAVAAERWPEGAVSTVGKIVWELGDGELGVCSGAIVDAQNGSVIATAAHCVTSPETPEPPDEAWFVPAYDHDRDHYRRDGWRVTSFHTPEGWDVGAADAGEMDAILPHDYAFLTVAARDGESIQRAHGANRPAFEPLDEGGEVDVLGYPAADPYDGESLHSCGGETEVLAADEAEEPNVGGLLLENCDMTAGSSGGPWLTDYEAATESGTLLAVMSVGSGEGEVIGRPFPEAARDLLAEAGQD